MDPEILEYHHMVVPSTMRSQYWKYFGFPSDNFNNIVTRKKVICTICSTAIAYNKNTSNLRTHLVARHPDILLQLNLDKPEKRICEIEELSDGKRQKIIMKQDSLFKSNEAKCDTIQINHSSVNSIIETLSENDIENTDEIDYQDYPSNLNSDYDTEEISEEKNSKSNINFTDILRDMIIKDLYAPSFVEGNGFQSLTWTLSGNIRIPSRIEMDNCINNLYNNKFSAVSEKIKLHSEKDHYSLSVEIWKNVEQKTLVNFYYNYSLQEDNPSLHNILFQIIELSKCSNFENVLEDLHLNNCVVVVINEPDEKITNFFSSNDIPVVLCFDSTITKCLKGVFGLPTVILLLEEIEEFLEQREPTVEINSIPEVLNEYPWTQYNLLKFFYANVCWTDDSSELLVKAKAVIDCLAPLKMALETLTDEQLPLSSLVRPLTIKLLDQYFSPTEFDIDIVLEIKVTIKDIVTKRVLSSAFFIEAAFFDPRFQNLIDSEGIKTVRKNLNMKMCKEDADVQTIKTGSPGSSRKSSLTRFFSNTEQKVFKIGTRNNLEVEITKYISETNADLEQCPLTWWNEVGYIYRNLKKISEKYLCVPCSINYIFKCSVEDQVEYLNRRFMLRGKYVRFIWFLHYNKDFIL